MNTNTSNSNININNGITESKEYKDLENKYKELEIKYNHLEKQYKNLNNECQEKVELYVKLVKFKMSEKITDNFII